MKNAKGFTLIEVLSVVTILGTLAIVFLPAVQ
jgi:prepilin-type N-terminal cleavage/methylation domain-containing protein